MSVLNTYKDFCCYKGMNSHHQEIFNRLASYYGEMLNKGPARINTIYTLHDFDHHCTNIYRAISIFLLQEDDEALSEEEWYILNLAILFHDISMCRGGFDKEKEDATQFDRNIHALQSEEWLLHEFENSKTVLRSGSDLNQYLVEIIGKICKAHSNIKRGGISSEINALFDADLPDSIQGTTQIIRVRLLAGLLRLADEMDVTVSRLGNDRIEEQFTIDSEDVESKKHWDRLHLINAIEIARDNSDVLQLQTADRTLQERLDSGDGMNVKDDLDNIVHKIQKELDNIWIILKADPQTARLITIRKVELFTNSESVREKLSMLEQAKLSPVVEKMPTLDEGIGSLADSTDEYVDSGEDTVLEIGGDISSILHTYVLRNRLLSVGHFQLNDKYCARDWLDTESIASDKEMSKIITKALAEAIEAYMHEANNPEYIIVGLGLVGTRQAAEVAFFMGKPFSYVIPAHQSENYDTHEIKMPKVNSSQKIIIITDCIVTGETIRRIISDNQLNNVIAVYSVFWRRPRNWKNLDMTLEEIPLYTLCKKFRAEVSLVRDCPFGKNLCEAPNRKQNCCKSSVTD